MKRVLSLFVLVLLVSTFPVSPALSQEEGLFTDLEGFATKTGFRGIFAWQTTAPVDGLVHYGTDPGNLTQTTRAIPGAADTAGMAIAEGLSIGATYYWQVEDLLTGEMSEVSSFKAANAYTDWDGSIYTLDILVQLDSQSLPPGVRSDLALQNIAAGMNVFAERLYDAMDGFARLGNVLVTDTNLDFGANIPFQPVACFTGITNAADVLIETSVPFDSHTFGGWSIEDPCISFYVGRLGQLVVPWGLGGSAEDLHFGYVSTHEMMHYAFNAPDLYNITNATDPAGCRNLTWDGSVMHNSGGWNGSRWDLTELDRNPALTPCDHQHNANWTWDALRTRYTNVPLRPAGPIDHIVDTKARGNADGGALDIRILDREPGMSTLTGFLPNDGTILTNPCSEPGFTVLTDASYDSLTARPEHDVFFAAIAEPFDLGAGKIVFTLEVDSLEALTPDTTWPINFVDPTGAARWVRMSTNAAAMPSFATGVGANASPFTNPGTPALPESGFEADGTIRIVLDRSSVGLSPGQALTQFLTRVRVELPTGGSITPDNMDDSLVPTGIYTSVGSENCQSLPPVAADDSAITSEDQAVDIAVLANDSDPDGDPLAITSVSAPANGTAAVVGSAIRYTPNADFFGVDAFGYQISDGRGGTANAQVALTITPVPDAPQAFDDRVTIVSGTSFRIPVLDNDRDGDGDSLSVVSATDPPNGIAQANPDGTVRYTPDPGFAGTDTFNYTASDGSLSDVGAVIVRVLAQGSANPCVLPGIQVVTDPSGDQLPGNGGEFDITSVSVAGLMPNGELVVTMKVAGPLNPPPPSNAWRVLFFSPNGTNYWVSLDTTDLLGGPRFRYGTRTGGSISDAGSADSGTFTPEGFITIGIKASKVGFLTPGVTITDVFGRAERFVGEGTSVGGAFVFMDTTGTGTYNVAACLQQPPNDPPSAIDDLVTTDEDVAALVSVKANDTDRNGDPLAISSFSQATNGSVQASGGGLLYTPEPNFNGSDEFSYTISDGQFTASAVVHVTVDPVNDLPVAFDDASGTDEDNSVIVDVLGNDSDVDGDVLSVSAVGSPANGVAAINGDGTITYTPNANYHGNDLFAYTLSDGNGGTDVATVFITIASVNDSPVVVDDAADCQKNGAVTVAVLANDLDVDGDVLSVVTLGAASNGTTRLNPDGSITYTPIKGFRGTDSFTYSISDGNGGTDTGTVNVTISKEPSGKQETSFLQVPLKLLSDLIGLLRP